ncbi:hypothetical protein [Streptomyces sp. ODS28]|uniref:hypothetical protein n=1 Tax=Streptomyces sp. ODS28 TaxID=3136688 RepID=UPI0031F02F56
MWEELSRGQQKRARVIVDELRRAGVAESVEEVARHYGDACAWEGGLITLTELCRRTGWPRTRVVPHNPAALRSELARLRARAEEIEQELTSAGEPTEG